MDDYAAIRQDLARAVRARRLAMDMTQADLARLADVSLRRIEAIEGEAAAANPSLRTMCQIAAVLQTTVPDLLGAAAPATARKRAPKKK